jgi:hypothetical protein
MSYITRNFWFLAAGIFILFILWILLDPDPAPEDHVPDEPAAAASASANADRGDGYTVMVYMNGSDLESTWDEESETFNGAATDDLLEMAEGLANDQVNVIIETGGTLEWAHEEIDGSQNQRWKLEDGRLIRLADLGPKNMGDPQTLTDFIAWTVEQYPSGNYALIFWDHGGGSVLGFGADELFDGDSLTLDEIAEGLSGAYEQTNQMLELVGFDACLMATVETAYKISPFARFMVASQELEPGHGWDYEAIFRYLSDNPSADGAALGKVIVDSYREHAMENGQDSLITLSVTDLGRVPAIVDALEAFVQEAAPEIAASDTGFYTLASSRSKAEDYGSTTAHGGLTDMADLVSIARHASGSYPATTDSLIKAVQSAVVYNLNSKGRPDASGLSVYFPHRDKDNFAENLGIYQQIGFSDAYSDFLQTYVARLTDKEEDIQITQTNQDAFHFEYGDDDSEMFEIWIDPDDLDRIEQIYGVVAMLSEDADGPILMLGYDHYVNMDWETGLLQDDFTGEWLTWDGHFISLYLVNQGEDYIQYAMPAILNGEAVDILIYFDLETESFEVLGAWRGINESTGMPDKNIIPVKAGDTIVPLYEYYYEDSDEEGYAEGDPFVVGEQIRLDYDWLPEGNYLYGFSIVDYAGNETYSDFVEIEFTE